jgi:hypothetical protein
LPAPAQCCFGLNGAVSREPDRDAETSAGNAPYSRAPLSAGCRITPAKRTSVPGSRPIGHQSPPLPVMAARGDSAAGARDAQDRQRPPAGRTSAFRVAIVERWAVTSRPEGKRPSQTPSGRVDRLRLYARHNRRSRSVTRSGTTSERTGSRSATSRPLRSAARPKRQRGPSRPHSSRTNSVAVIRHDRCPLLLAQAERHYCDPARPSVVEVAWLRSRLALGAQFRSGQSLIWTSVCQRGAVRFWATS